MSSYRSQDVSVLVMDTAEEKSPLCLKNISKGITKSQLLSLSHLVNISLSPPSIQSIVPSSLRPPIWPYDRTPSRALCPIIVRKRERGG